MAETGNENGRATEDRRAGSEGRPPSVAPTDPEWQTGDFASLDLGEDSIDTSARPVRRLDLPPLTHAGEDVSGSADLDRPTSLGVFASVPDDENMSVSSTAAAAERTRGPVGDEAPTTPGFEAAASAPKQGTPPHPRTAARGHGPAAAAPLRGDHDGYRSHGAPGGYPGSGDRTTVYEEDMSGFDDRFDGPDRRQPAMGGGRPPGGGGHGGGEGGRPQLELAPSMPVQQAGSRWLVPVAALLGVLALAAGYWVFVRGDSDDSGTFAADSDDLAADLAEDDGEGDPTDGADAGTEPAAPAVLSDSPVLTVDGAADGPLEVETSYEVTIDGVPEDAEFLVVVDDIPQEPALDYIPTLILPEGRHTITVTVTSGDKTVNTNPVEVYVLAPELTATYRANLSSVSVSDQGWAEALKQFDEFRAAGHENLMLSPSDPYPSLLPGFWNLYVPGFADDAGARAYCEQFGLAIPDACFATPFDPDAPPRDG